MSHFAKVMGNTVIEVVVAEQDVIDSWLFGDPAQWVQTSYNTRGGAHYGSDGLPDGGTPLRKNHAAPGYTYDRELDAFIPPKPFPSWLFNEDTCLWDPPIPYPESTNAPFVWSEEEQNWVQVVPPEV